MAADVIARARLVEIEQRIDGSCPASDGGSRRWDPKTSPERSFTAVLRENAATKSQRIGRNDREQNVAGNTCYDMKNQQLRRCPLRSGRRACGFRILSPSQSSHLGHAASFGIGFSTNRKNRVLRVPATN